MALRLLPALLLSACAMDSRQTALPVHEVFLLVGQSNMSGRGIGDDPLAKAESEPRLLMWDPAAQRLTAARDPLPHQDLGRKPVSIGPGISFGRSWLAGNGKTVHVVLVPAAFGGTGFSDNEGSWRVTGPTVSPLMIEAVARANAAVRAVRATGARVHVAGILWHQGETDGVNRMGAAAYGIELSALAGYLRSHIDGAGPATPFVVGQYVPSEIASNQALQSIAVLNRALASTLQHSACAASRGLEGNPTPDSIHFNTASQRALGERYAAALAALRAQAPATACDW